MPVEIGSDFGGNLVIGIVLATLDDREHEEADEEKWVLYVGGDEKVGLWVAVVVVSDNSALVTEDVAEADRSVFSDELPFLIGWMSGWGSGMQRLQGWGGEDSI